MQFHIERGSTTSTHTSGTRAHDRTSSGNAPSHVDHHMQELSDIANQSSKVQQLKSYQEMADSRVIQPKHARSHHTGLPENLKSGIEQLSGFSMDDVKVHYNSSKPAQLQAHAYAQGSEIHLAPGQETHLPHEAWHVVQQKQGRVKPTVQLKEKTAINDDPDLEKEADEMGAKAVAQRRSIHPEQSLSNRSSSSGGKVVQCVPAKKKKKKKKSRTSPPSNDFKRRVVTIRNKDNYFSSGIIDSTTLPRGVNAGPQAEAQKVQKILGGSWVGGHMVNDSLGGSGGFDNIVPITASMNGRHKTIENKANNLLNANKGTEIEYEMNILKRTDVTFDNKTIKGLPVKFKQKLTAYYSDGTEEEFNGKVLAETGL